MADGAKHVDKHQWINGVTTSEQSYTYGYTVTAGNELQIPSFNWRTNKGLQKSNSVRVMVEANKEKRPSKGLQAKKRGRCNAIWSRPLNPTSARVFGRAAGAHLQIYNRYNNLDVRNYDIPELEGFWKETVDAPEARWEPQLINGKRYNVATVRRSGGLSAADWHVCPGRLQPEGLPPHQFL